MAFPEVVFRDLMHRSWQNLLIVEEIQRKREGEEDRDYVKRVGPYEVTQLINSFLGVFGLPRENEIPDELSEYTLEDAQDWGFPVLIDTYPEVLMISRSRGTLILKTEMNLNDVCKLLRNGIVHGNFEFSGHSDAFGDTQISGISIWNERDNKERSRNWGCRITIAELRQVLSSFYAIASHIYEQSENRRKEYVG